MSGERNRKKTSATLWGRLRTVALPPEHGTWGLVLEPLVLGLLVAPSLAGMCLACGAFAAFLARRPFKVRISQAGTKRTQRTTMAELFFGLYASLALLGTAGAVALSGTTPLVPLALALPLLAVFVVYDFKNRTRSWQAELAGAIAFAAVASGIALASHWLPLPAFALTAVIAARGVPSILYVRTRIRLDRGRPYRIAPTMAAHVAGFALVLWLVATDLIPALVIIAFVALTIRAAVGLSSYRPRVSIQELGFAEMKLGVLTVASVAVGFWTGT